MLPSNTSLLHHNRALYIDSIYFRFYSSFRPSSTILLLAMVQLFAVLCFICILPHLAIANTETYLLQIPHYFDIPVHPEPIDAHHLQSRDVRTINDTHSVILDFPIQSNHINESIYNRVSLPYDAIHKVPKKLLVKLTNYEDEIFTSDDLIYVKLCWPATSPIDFRLSHAFHRMSDVVYDYTIDTFDVYLEVELSSDFHTYNSQIAKSFNTVDFQLYITKLPLKWLPVPIELYDYIVYVVDIVILLVNVIVPWLYQMVAQASG